MIVTLCDICEQKTFSTQEYVLPMSYELKIDKQPRIYDTSHAHLCERCRLEIARFIKKLKEEKEEPR